jgi:solute:Na+ symporter, SSS family
MPTTTSVVVLVLTLVAFAVLGLAAARRARGDTDLTTANRTQGPIALGFSFAATGLGAWILFAPAEVGALIGIDALVGYAVAAAAPYLVFAWLGPALRRRWPAGRGLTDTLRDRFGRSVSVGVLVVSLAYMAVFVTAELLAVASVVELLGGVPRAVTVLAVAAVTLAYTAIGGLRASLATDRWQAVLVVVLLVLAATAVAANGAAAPVVDVEAAGLLAVDRVGVEAALTLVIAVTAANVFHQGYWQRVWAARDDRTLRRGALLGAAGAAPVVLAVGLAGILATSRGLVASPTDAAVSVFALAGGLPQAVTIAVLVLGIALVASSLDSLESGLTSLVVAENPRAARSARWLTVALVVPCVAGALVATSVLQLFLIADLLAAAIVVPALAGVLWRRATGPALVSGGASGLAGAYLAAWVATGDLAAAWAAVTFVGAVPTLPPFLGAVVASSLVMVVVALASRTPDLGAEPSAA